MEWIEFKKKKPENTGYYITYEPDDRIVGESFYLDDVQSFVDDSEYHLTYEYEKLNVSHWMPLPEPPKP